MGFSYDFSIFHLFLDSEQGFLKLIRGTVLDVNQIGVQMLG